jgi:hypothetical protein
MTAVRFVTRQLTMAAQKSAPPTTISAMLGV